MPSDIISVYTAGAIDGPNITEILGNLHIGIEYAKIFIKIGMYPICPHLSFMYRLIDDDWNMAHEDEQTLFYELGKKAVEMADCVFVCPGSDESKGTAIEVAHAKEIGKRVFWGDVKKLQEWAKKMEPGEK